MPVLTIAEVVLIGVIALILLSCTYIIVSSAIKRHTLRKRVEQHLDWYIEVYGLIKWYSARDIIHADEFEALRTDYRDCIETLGKLSAEAKDLGMMEYVKVLSKLERDLTRALNIMVDYVPIEGRLNENEKY